MKQKNIIITCILIVTLIAGYLAWQGNILPVLNQNINNSADSSLSNDNSGTTSEQAGFIEELRKREFNGGNIKTESMVNKNDLYTTYIFSYPSDDLTIYGMMNTPKGSGPFPVVILNHGYYNTSSFKSGDGTQTIAEILARNGYITLASDYRGHGKSESDEKRGGHRPEYSIDVLNLLASVKSIDKADVNNIGMWGHSMGGEVSMRAIETTNKIKAVALWAPTSANASDNHSFYGGNRNTQEVTPADDGISPINYLRYITSPISLHQGLADVEVNPEWSKELRDALISEGKTVEYFEYEGQDHNFRNLGWDEISEKTLTFYDRYLR